LPTEDCQARGGGECRIVLDFYAEFHLCMDGPGQPVDSDCDCYDLNGDGVITLEDFADLQNSFSAGG
jgi:hypothetical protein